MAKFASCETCPFYVDPDNEELWAQIAERQRRVTPEYTDETNAHLTEVERARFRGMKESLPNCPGYKPIRHAIMSALFRFAQAPGYMVDTESGIRIVPLAEKSCKNPFIGSDEDTALANQLTRSAAEAYDKKIQSTRFALDSGDGRIV